MKQHKTALTHYRAQRSGAARIRAELSAKPRHLRLPWWYKHPRLRDRFYRRLALPVEYFAAAIEAETGRPVNRKAILRGALHT